MENYGEILKRARESKQLDYETISRETTISVPFLKGLEEEDTDAFPGEAYMLGFMRNYAEYLGVNPDKVLSSYRSKKLQEAPVPEGLTVREKPKYFWPLIFTGISLFLIAVCVVIGIFAFKKKASNSEEVVLDKKSVVKKYEITNKALSQRFYVGDQLVYHTSEGDIILTVSDTLSSFGLQTPVGTLYTDLSEEAELDVDGDARTTFLTFLLLILQEVLKLEF